MIDEKTIEEICSSTWEPLYRFIYYKVQNREEAEDITQETYVKAISYFQKNNIKIETYIAYLKAVSLNVLRDRWRKNKLKGTVVDIEAINPAEISVEDSAETSDEKEILQSALNRIREEYRTVVELRILKGYSVAEASKIMNKTEGAIRVLQHRALKEIAGILKDKDSSKEGSSNE
ncbi:MAG: polymerase, sigma-24 subunit, subfamily [Clostridia bacterium]|jgi:RNA polymerase sigma-70 factor (ECF subfamily)|nr:polymerase, sigma-24 subunit, subfamily [Clostridia bacterium]